MCKCCSETQKNIWVFGCGSFSLLIALILGVLWPKLSLDIIYSRLVLEEGSLSYDNWVKSPFPLYLEVTMWNWTNSDQVLDHSVKPHFVEMGPYIFSELHERVDVNFHPDNNTVTFNQTGLWQFIPELSKGTLDDVVTNLNVIPSSVAYIVRNDIPFVQMAANALVNSHNGSLFLSKTVRELIFDGYQDAVLDALIEFESPLLTAPFTKFGWFVDRNGSSEYSGAFNIFTGTGDINDLGRIHTWDGRNRTDFYRDECGRINGTTGELWPPGINTEKPISLFVPDICRSLTLTRDDDFELYGLNGVKWVGNDSVFDNGVKYPNQLCFCGSDVEECPDLLPGLLNISSCRFNAPAFVSFPHFYLADPSYVNDIEGVNPIKEKHEFSVALEPLTGIPLEVNGRIQINLLLQEVPHFTIYAGVPKVVVPMLWVNQYAQLPEDLAGDARLAGIVHVLGSYIAYGLAGLGALLVIVGSIVAFSRSWKRKKAAEIVHERL